MGIFHCYVCLPEGKIGGDIPILFKKRSTKLASFWTHQKILKFAKAKMQLCTLGPGCTPPKTNMSRKKEPFQKESSLSSTTFQETTNPSVFFHNVPENPDLPRFYKRPRKTNHTDPQPALVASRATLHYTGQSWPSSPCRNGSATLNLGREP